MLIGNEKLNIEMIKKELFPVFKKHDVKKAFVYGSVAKKRNNIDSDVDILVDSRLKGFKFLGLIEDIHNTLNKEVDVIDVSHIRQNSRIDNEIKLSGVLIYD